MLTILRVSLAIAALSSAAVAAQSITDELRQRTRFTVPDSGPGARTFSLPPGVTSTETLTATNAVAVALWNNTALQADLARLEVSRADLVEAALFRNPSLSSLLLFGVNGCHFPLD